MRRARPFAALTLQVKHLRTAALRKGFKLNDNALVDRHGAPLPTEHEHDVFRLVGVPYLEPHQRRFEIYGPLLGLLV